MSKEKIKDIYVVAPESEESDFKLYPPGTEKFYVYGGRIGFFGRIEIYSDNEYKFSCSLSNNFPCEMWEKDLQNAKEKGVEYKTYVANISKVKDPENYIHFDGGDFETYIKTEIINWEDPRFWDIFIDRVILNKPGYENRLISPEIGEKLLTNQSVGLFPNDLWNAIIWNPDDIVKERMPDGTYIYKDDIAANKGYNPWRKSNKPTRKLPTEEEKEEIW